jgi:hypothetical protein
MADEGADAVPDERDDVSRVGAEGVRELGSREEEDEVRRRVEQGKVLWLGFGISFEERLLRERRGYLSPIRAWRSHGTGNCGSVENISPSSHSSAKPGETHCLRGWSFVPEEQEVESQSNERERRGGMTGTDCATPREQVESVSRLGKLEFRIRSTARVKRCER